MELKFDYRGNQGSRIQWTKVWYVNWLTVDLERITKIVELIEAEISEESHFEHDELTIEKISKKSEDTVSLENLDQGNYNSLIKISSWDWKCEVGNQRFWTFGSASSSGEFQES